MSGGEAESERTLARGELGVLGEGEHVPLRSTGDAARALVVAGKPLNEPVVQHGHDTATGVPHRSSLGAWVPAEPPRPRSSLRWPFLVAPPSSGRTR